MNTELGERAYFNFNCVVLDVCPVRIGCFTLFGPAVQILTPLHPFDAALRRELEDGKPITIGDDESLDMDFPRRTCRRGCCA